jgi:hypothetical protein
MEATAKDDVPRIHPVQCPNGKAIDPYPVWSEVENTNQAKLFLRGQFNKIGDVDNFAIWLSCQSFIVRVMPANKPNPLNSTRLIIGSFMASGAGRDTLWDGRLLRFPPIYSTSVYLYLDDLNNFLSVEIEYTVQ